MSQWRTQNSNLTTRQVASIIKRTASNSKKEALTTAIKPIVEHYPIEKTSSPQDARWHILPTNRTANPIEFSLRGHLEESKGVYFFYDSAGKVIYTGKTEKQTLWREINNAFNRERQAHKAYQVKHPTTGDTFTPAWEKLRQPRSKVIHLHNTAMYFSAYEVSTDLIGNLEAMLIRALCNDLSNVKMEKFEFDF